MNHVSEILRKIGQAGHNEDGSYTRTCYSPEYFQAVDIVEQEMRALGMEISRDAAGNIHGVLPGSQPGAESIVLGSHLDTVPSGGLFDCAAPWRFTALMPRSPTQSAAPLEAGLLPAL